MKGLLASDLDRTLVHPKRTLPPEYAGDSIDVEIYEERPITVGSREALRALEDVARAGAFLPVTTRSLAQLQRITPIWALARESWAVCANGATLLHRGDVDVEWRDRLASSRDSAAPLEDARAAFLRAVNEAPWLLRLRTCDDVFLYGICELADMPAGSHDPVAEAMAGLGWEAVLHGRKLYALPAYVTKVACVEHVLERTGGELLVAAGDSLLDRPLLERADVAFCPADAELVTLDAVPDGTTVTRAGHLGAAREIAAAAVDILL